MSMGAKVPFSKSLGANVPFSDSGTTSASRFDSCLGASGDRASVLSADSVDTCMPALALPSADDAADSVSSAHLGGWLAPPWPFFSPDVAENFSGLADVDGCDGCDGCDGGLMFGEGGSGGRWRLASAMARSRSVLQARRCASTACSPARAIFARDTNIYPTCRTQPLWSQQSYVCYPLNPRPRT
jgi:hypothetical protein